jgi:hypothetical protein
MRDGDYHGFELVEYADRYYLSDGGCYCSIRAVRAKQWPAGDILCLFDRRLQLQHRAFGAVPVRLGGRHKFRLACGRDDECFQVLDLSRNLYRQGTGTLCEPHGNCILPFLSPVSGNSMPCTRSAVEPVTITWIHGSADQCVSRVDGRGRKFIRPLFRDITQPCICGEHDGNQLRAIGPELRDDLLLEDCDKEQLRQLHRRAGLEFYNGPKTYLPVLPG